MNLLFEDCRPGAPLATFRVQDKRAQEIAVGVVGPPLQTILEGVMSASGMFVLEANFPDDFLSSTTAHQEAYFLALLYWRVNHQVPKLMEGKVSSVV